MKKTEAEYFTDSSGNVFQMDSTHRYGDTSMIDSIYYWSRNPNTQSYTLGDTANDFYLMKKEYFVQTATIDSSVTMVIDTATDTFYPQNASFDASISSGGFDVDSSITWGYDTSRGIFFPTFSTVYYSDPAGGYDSTIFKFTNYSDTTLQIFQVQVSDNRNNNISRNYKYSYNTSGDSLEFNYFSNSERRGDTGLYYRSTFGTTPPDTLRHRMTFYQSGTSTRDSVLTYNKVAGSWSLTKKREYFYNGQGLLIADTIYDWVEDSSSYFYSEGRTRSYDTAGRQIAYESYSYNTSSKTWSMAEANYDTYDANGNHLIDLDMNAGDTLSYDSSVYDSQNRLVYSKDATYSSGSVFLTETRTYNYGTYTWYTYQYQTSSTWTGNASYIKEDNYGTIDTGYYFTFDTAANDYMITHRVLNDNEDFNTDLLNAEQSSESLELFPNPNKGRATLILPEMVGQSELTIFNVSGQLVKQERLELNFGERPYQLNTSELKDGLYIILLTNGSERYTARMLKQ